MKRDLDSPDEFKSPKEVFQDTLDKSRKIPLAKLGEIIEQHRVWIQSKGAEGRRADLSGADFFLVNFERFWLPKGILKGANFLASALKNATLSDADLRECNLNDADLRDAGLSGADLRGAYLMNARLAGARLTDCKLQGAKLRGAVFDSEEKSDSELAKEIEEVKEWLAEDEEPTEGTEPEKRRPAADVTGADFRHADLCDARLSEAIGLNPDRLSGTDLTGAKIPGDIAKLELLDYIAELSKVARSTYLALLTASLYCWLMIATTADVTGGGGQTSVALPIIDTSVPVRGFFLAGPVILLVTLIYLHTYLQRLWAALATLPARFPDGRSLDERVYPWLFTSLVRLYIPRLKVNRPRLWWLQVAMTVLSAWVIVPVTIIGFVVRYWGSSDSLGIAALALTTVASFVTVAGTWRLAQSTLRGGSNHYLAGSRATDAGT